MTSSGTLQAGTQSPLAAVLTATHQAFLVERPPGADEDVHMLPAVVDHVITRCSAPGDVVFDPFAGFGTTLGRSVALGRRALGIELLPERVDHIRRQIPDALIIEGDARVLLSILSEVLPGPLQASVNLILTSPPYMTATYHDADPLTAYEQNTGDYDRYLRELGVVAAQCAQLIAPGGFVVWNVADIGHRGHTTHLVADCARVLAEHLAPIGTTEIKWDRLPHDLESDALLVFQRPAAEHPPNQDQHGHGHAKDSTARA